MAAMEEYRDGTLYLYRLGLGEWKRLDENDTPTYHTVTKPRKGEVFEVNVDGNEIVVTHSFENRSNATTRHSLIIRRSTGRFTEHYESESGNPLDYAGTCQIYQPRE